MQSVEQIVWEKYFGKNAKSGFDAFGVEIRFDCFGMKEKYGWNLDYIWPLKPNKPNYKNGSSSIDNLQPLSYKSSLKKDCFLTGKINGIIFAVVKNNVDNENKPIGKMKVKKEDGLWYWTL